MWPRTPSGSRASSDYVYFGWGQRRTDIWVMDVVQDDGTDD